MAVDVGGTRPTPAEKRIVPRATASPWEMSPGKEAEAGSRCQAGRVVSDPGLCEAGTGCGKHPTGASNCSSQQFLLRALVSEL